MRWLSEKIAWSPQYNYSMTEESSSAIRSGFAFPRELILSVGFYVFSAYIVGYVHLGAYLAVFGVAALSGQASAVDVILSSHLTFVALVLLLLFVFDFRRAEYSLRVAKILSICLGLFTVIVFAVAVLKEPELSEWGIIHVYDLCLGLLTAFVVLQVWIVANTKQEHSVRLIVAILLAFICVPALTGRRDGLIDRLTSLRDQPKVLIKGSSTVMPVLLMTPQTVFCLTGSKSNSINIRPVKWEEVVSLSTEPTLRMLWR